MLSEPSGARSESSGAPISDYAGICEGCAAPSIAPENRTRKEGVTMFFKVIAAIVTADAFGRHMREQQRRGWLAEEERRLAPTPGTAGRRQIAATPATWDSTAPKRPA